MLATPVAGDEREPAILDLVPLAGAIRWPSCLASSMAFAIARLQRSAHARFVSQANLGMARWGACRLLWIGRKSRPFVISATQFDETPPARRCLLQSWHGVRAAYPMPQLKREIISGGRFGPAKGQFITRSQIHGWRTDSRVRVLHAQPHSRAEQHHELAASDETCHLIPPEGCGPTIAQSTPTSGGVFRGLPVTV